MYVLEFNWAVRNIPARRPALESNESNRDCSPVTNFATVPTGRAGSQQLDLAVLYYTLLIQSLALIENFGQPGRLSSTLASKPPGRRPPQLLACGRGSMSAHRKLETVL